MQIVSSQSLFSGKNNKNIIKLSSADFVQSMVSVMLNSR